MKDTSEKQIVGSTWFVVRAMIQPPGVVETVFETPSKVKAEEWRAKMESFGYFTKRESV